jgi:hypothetical protein
MICSSLNRVRFIVRPFSGRTLINLGWKSGGHVTSHSSTSVIFTFFAVLENPADLKTRAGAMLQSIKLYSTECYRWQGKRCSALTCPPVRATPSTMEGPARIIPSQPLSSLAPKTASGGKIRARRFAPGKCAAKPLYRLGKSRPCGKTRIGHRILANTIGNLVAGSIVQENNPAPAAGGSSAGSGFDSSQVQFPADPLTAPINVLGSSIPVSSSGTTLPPGLAIPDFAESGAGAGVQNITSPIDGDATEIVVVGSRQRMGLCCK